MDFRDTQKRYVAFPRQNTWILISFDLNFVSTRQTSEKVAYKSGFGYLLECFFPNTFARIISFLPEKMSKISGTGGAATPTPSRLPDPYAYAGSHISGPTEVHRTNDGSSTLAKLFDEYLNFGKTQRPKYWRSVFFTYFL